MSLVSVCVPSTIVPLVAPSIVLVLPRVCERVPTNPGPLSYFGTPVDLAWGFPSGISQTSNAIHQSTTIVLLEGRTYLRVRRCARLCLNPWQTGFIFLPFN